jgi:hypothetical protein
MKLTEQELDKLKYFQQNINQNIFDLGQLEIDIHNFTEALRNSGSQKVDIIAHLEKLAEQESDFLKELEIKYGKGIIDPSTGEITKTTSGI